MYYAAGCWSDFDANCRALPGFTYDGTGETTNTCMDWCGDNNGLFCGPEAGASRSFLVLTLAPHASRPGRATGGSWNEQDSFPHDVVPATAGRCLQRTR